MLEEIAEVQGGRGKIEDKFILDATCGGRTMWFQKDQPNTLYCDIRTEPRGFIVDRPKFEIMPDVISDFREMKFPDRSFKLVVWDPPHLPGLSKKSWICKKYGTLNGETWLLDIQRGFSECMRVLDDYGILILKWSHDPKRRGVSPNDIICHLPIKPLFGHSTGSKSNTMWMTFMKMPTRP